MNCRYSSGVQKPITRSTPARLYQLRLKSTISSRREELGESLKVPAGTLTLVRFAERDDSSFARTQISDDAFDRTVFTRGVPTFEDDHDLAIVGDDVALQFHQFNAEFVERLLIRFF